ncbi:MAG: polysaccharide pyruvyl transferase family protein, partial [Planctomycetota bacterium]
MATKICILGLTVSGNRGAESMLLSIVQHMRRLLGECEFDLVSVYPKEDRRSNLPAGLRVVSGKPLTMLALVLPLSIIAGPLIRLPAVRSALRKHQVFRALLDSDLVLDSGGVAFIDGRGLARLLYNASLCLPPVRLGIPTVKLAQAMGPFRSFWNRVLARR